MCLLCLLWLSITVPYAESVQSVKSVVKCPFRDRMLGV